MCAGAKTRCSCNAHLETSAPLKTTPHLVLRGITEVRVRVGARARARARGKARAGVV